MSVVFARTKKYPRHQRLDVYAGDGLEFSLTYEEELVGEVVGEIRRDRRDADPLDSFLVGVEGNVATVMLTGDQTAALGSFVGFYDVQWRADESAEWLTLIQGSLFCALDVTRTSGPPPPEPFEPPYPLTESAFLVDGPLADPWVDAGLASYPGHVPEVTAGIAFLAALEEAQTVVAARPDLSPAEVVGIRSGDIWWDVGWGAGVKLFLLGPGEPPAEWYELQFSWTGTEFRASVWKATEDGATYVELIPDHQALPFEQGWAVALQVVGTTIRYLVSQGGETVDLFEQAANNGQATLAGPFRPAFLIIGDAGVGSFFSGGPPED
jgi:hypothetical protein